LQPEVQLTFSSLRRFLTNLIFLVKPPDGKRKKLYNLGFSLTGGEFGNRIILVHLNLSLMYSI